MAVRRQALHVAARALEQLLNADTTLQTEIQNDFVQEIKALLGPQAIRDLDFEAVEMAVRRQALHVAARRRW